MPPSSDSEDSSSPAFCSAPSSPPASQPLSVLTEASTAAGGAAGKLTAPTNAVEMDDASFSPGSVDSGFQSVGIRSLSTGSLSAMVESFVTPTGKEIRSALERLRITLDYGRETAPVAPVVLTDYETDGVPTPSPEEERDRRLAHGYLLTNALVKGGRSFALGYSVRTGMTLLLKLTLVLRNKSKLRDVLVEALVNREGLRYGAAVGGFTLVWTYVHDLLHHEQLKHQHTTGHLPQVHPRLKTAAAGSLAALNLIFLPRSVRSALTIQMLLRAGAVLYNHNKARGRIHLPQGDAALFSLSVGQLIYAFLMCPETMPRSYYHWVLNVSNIDPRVLALNRAVIENDGQVYGGANLIGEVFQAIGGTHATVESCKESVAERVLSGAKICTPCHLLHQHSPSCAYHALFIFLRGMKIMLPVHLALNLAPSLALKFQQFKQEPKATLTKATLASLQSSTVVAIIVSVLKGFYCAHNNVTNALPSSSGFRTLLTNPSFIRKYYYSMCFLGGLIAIFAEQKRRRADLALFMLPKAMESLYHMLVAQKWLPNSQIPQAVELLGGMGAFGVLMAWYKENPDMLNPMLRGVLRRVVG